MPILVEWNFSRSPTWTIGDFTGWGFGGDTGWAGTDEALAYCADEPAALEKFWRPYIAGFTAPYRKLATVHGGYLRWEFGSIEVTPDFFFENDLWPPPKNSSIKVWYTATTESAKTKILDSDVHRTSFDRHGVVYDIYGPKFSEKLLEEREDYNGDVSPLPEVFGTISHGTPVRLPDAGNGNRSYWACGLRDGTLGVDWHVFDDGVNIDSNVSLPADPFVFELTAEPTGEVTVSGTSALETVSDVFDWATERISAEYDGSLGADPSPGIDYFATSQTLLIDFLSSVAAWACHFFWIDDTILYFADMAEDNGTATLSEYQFFTSVYDCEPPIAKLTAEWTTREAVEETIGKYVKDVENEVVVTSSYEYGDEKQFAPLNAVKATVRSRLESIRDFIHADRAEITMPLEGAIPVPGKKLTIIDDSGPDTITAVVRAREFRLDVYSDSLQMAISGEGAIS